VSAESTARVSLRAPLTGVMVPIEDVPDPVFARKMVGDGFSVDPLEGRLTSPVPGEVVDLQPSRHAITVRSAEGLEILMHIGLDTVRLGGDGFRAHVSEGQRVGAGDLLIDFDLDDVGRKAKSLLTQVVVTNTELLSAIIPVTGLVSGGIDEAAVVELKPLEESTQESGTAVDAASDALVVPNPTGLHARPTATLVALAKQYRSDIQLRRGDDSANAKSIVAIMSLAVACGEKVVVTAHGTDAKEAVAAISQGIREGLGEDCPTLPSGGVVGTEDTIPIPTITEPVAETAGPRSGDWNLLLGASASPGLGIGRVVQLHHEDIVVEEFAEDRHKERRKLNSAIDRALLDLSALQKRMSEEASEEKAAIFAAHQEILGDPELLDLAASAIDKGKSAAFAWRGAFNAFADQLAGLKNEILAGRANDVRDVGQRVLEELTGQRSDKGELPENTILVAEELTPSDTAQLDRSRGGRVSRPLRGRLGPATGRAHRRRRLRPVHLRLPRRHHPQHRGVRGGLPLGAHHPAGAELPLHPEHPLRRQCRHLPQQRPAREEPVDRRRGRRPHHRLCRRLRARRGPLDQPGGRPPGRRARRAPP